MKYLSKRRRSPVKRRTLCLLLALLLSLGLVSPAAAAPAEPSAQSVQLQGAVTPAGEGVYIYSPFGTSVGVGRSHFLFALPFRPGGNVSLQETGSSTVKPMRVTWSTADPSIATVNANGVVKGVSPGYVTIHAAAADGRTGSILIHVTALDYSDYCYSFVNKSSSFGYPSVFIPSPTFSNPGRQVQYVLYSIPRERYNQAGYTYFEAAERVRTWSGSCFGMSASSILFYMDYLQEEHYDPSVHAPVEFAKPNSKSSADTKLREMIELLQAMQRLIPDHKFSAKAVARELDAGRPVVLGLGVLGSYGSPHSVVAHSYTIQEDGTYRFEIYDCSGFVDAVICDPVSGVVFCIYTSSDSPSFLPTLYQTYSDIRKRCESSRKENNWNAASLFSVEDPRTSFCIPADDMTIQNAEQQTADILNGQLTGNIPDVEFSVSEYMEDAEPFFTILAPAGAYTFSSPDALSAAGEDLAADIQAKGPITVSGDLKTISAGTEAGDPFSVAFTTWGNAYDRLILSGAAAGEVTVTLGEDTAIVTGASDLTASATVSDSTVALTPSEDGGAWTVPLTVTEQRTKLAAPTGDADSGAYSSGFELNLASEDPDATICYTIDGGDEQVYSLPIRVTRSMTVTAHTERYGYLDSDPLTLTYTLPAVPAPRATVASGAYDRVLYVDLLDDDPDAYVSYTLDGSDPAEYGFPCFSTLVLTEDATVTACAISNNCVSDVVTYEYKVSPAESFLLENTPLALSFDGVYTWKPVTVQSADDLRYLSLTVRKLAEGDRYGRFLVAFYDADGRYLCSETAAGTAENELETIYLEITDDVSQAARLKVFILDEDYRPIGEAEEFVLAEP